MKMFICQIGYQHFACTMAQGVALMNAMEPLRIVKHHNNYRDFVFAAEEDADSKELISSFELKEVYEPAPPPPPAPPPEPLAITDQTERALPAPAQPYDPTNTDDIPF